MERRSQGGHDGVHLKRPAPGAGGSDRGGPDCGTARGCMEPDETEPKAEITAVAGPDRQDVHGRHRLSAQVSMAPNGLNTAVLPAVPAVVQIQPTQPPGAGALLKTMSPFA